MSEHPTLDQIVDRVLGRAGDADDELSAHLAGCASCREAEAWAAALVSAAADGPTPAAPDAWIEKAVEIPALDPRPRPVARRWSIARLVEDAFARPLLAGVRGAATSRRLLYDVDGGHVDLEVASDPEDAERFRITGQVLLEAGDPPGDLAVILWRGTGRAARGEGDDTGVFVLPGVPAGEYRLEILSLAAGAAIRIGGVTVKAGPA